MPTVQVQSGQTVPDIAMQQNGSAEAMFTLARLNGVSVTAALGVNQVVNYDAVAYDKQTAKIFQDYGYKPASLD